MNIQKRLKEGVELQQCGKLREAEVVFRKVMKASPADFVSLYSLGVIAEQTGRHEEALKFIERAILVNEGYAPLGFNRGVVLKALARNSEALESYDRALQIDPSHSSSALNRAILLSEAPAAPQPTAEQAIKRALELHHAGELDLAEALFSKILAVNPTEFVSLYSLGVIAHQKGESLQALHHFEAVSQANPSFAPSWYNRGAALQGLKRNEEALESYDRALELDPRYPEALVNRGAVLQEMSRHTEALENYDRLLQFAPENDKALANKGILLTEFKRFDEATVTFRELLKVNPEFDYAPGLLCFAQLHACNWEQLSEQAERLAEGVAAGKRVSKSLALLAISDRPALHRRCSAIFGEQMYPVKAPLWQGEHYRHDRIRVAYVSPDLREHPVGHLMAGIFENHDKSRFETIAISLGIDDGSELRQRMMQSFDRFIDCRRMNSRDIAQQMRALEVDIAIDLAGYTADSRTDIFAWRPAPVQVNYLGYPSTLGLGYLDYILADRFVIPEEHHPHFTEKVVYLPDSYLPSDATLKVAQETPERAHFGLPAEGFVYCSFNHAYKINPDIFEVWMRILERTPGSVLWLMRLNGSAEGNLRREAQARGIDPERLIFATRVPRVEDHLARYRLADLFLDTTPYNAHTTASDALFVGLPVLTCLGSAFPGRVAAGLLDAIGLPELVTPSLAAYQELAVELAGDPARLRALRDRLAANRTTHPLFDTRGFCRNLEEAYRGMWRRSQEGVAPESFRVARQAGRPDPAPRLAEGAP